MTYNQYHLRSLPGGESQLNPSAHIFSPQLNNPWSQLNPYASSFSSQLNPSPHIWSSLNPYAPPTSSTDFRRPATPPLSEFDDPALLTFLHPSFEPLHEPALEPTFRAILSAARQTQSLLLRERRVVRELGVVIDRLQARIIDNQTIMDEKVKKLQDELRSFSEPVDINIQFLNNDVSTNILK